MIHTSVLVTRLQERIRDAQAFILSGKCDTMESYRATVAKLRAYEECVNIATGPEKEEIDKMKKHPLVDRIGVQF